ncbi:MAG TPA: SPW repeat protein [Chloroflexota bacterium]|nr:SPW repeat protein [Chloroflexota bacterium]
MLRWLLPAVDVVLGLWLIVAPYALPFLGYTGAGAVTTSSIIAGALVAIVSFVIWLGQMGYVAIFGTQTRHA